MAERTDTWSRDELILAVDLYLRKGESAPSEDCRALSHTLRSLRRDMAVKDERFRSRSAVAYKLQNIASKDPDAGTRRRHDRGGEQDGRVLEEFRNNPEALSREVSRIVESIPATPAPSKFEQELSASIATRVTEGGTGPRWGDEERLIAEELGLSPYSYKKTVSMKRTDRARTRDAYRESGRSASATLFVIVLHSDATLEHARKSLEEEMRVETKTEAIALVTSEDDGWRVRSIIAARNGDVLHALLEAFPAAATDFTVLSDVTLTSLIEPTDDNLKACRSSFTHFADSQGMSLDVTTALDLLAVTLSSQFVLFAGPSGTGKSLSARMLMRFFAAQDSQAIIDARRHWIGPEDVVGYFSPLTATFMPAPDAAGIIALGTTEDESAPLEAGPGAPFLLVEEMNLAPIDGYLSPLVHGMSGLSSRLITWALAAEGTSEDPHLPSAVHLGPHMRLFGTINVDATAPSPPRKVSARAAVVLVEPVPLPDEEELLRSLEADGSGVPEGGNPPGLGMAQDPRAIVSVASPNRRRAAYEALKKALSLLPEDVVVSHRDVRRALLYMLWYAGLSADLHEAIGGEAEVLRAAGENALLHFVLPGLSPAAFLEAVRGMSESGALRSTKAQPLAGQLEPRLARLRAAMDAAGGFTLAMDFWTALS